jgi:hypothetical protein
MGNERPAQRRVHLTGRVGRTKDARSRRRVNLSLSRGSYDRLEQIATWEGRLPTVVAEALMHLGLEVYQVLLDRIAGRDGQLTLPEGLPAVPGMEMLIEAVGRGALAREAARRLEQRSREIVGEQRRDRERACAMRE